MKAHALSERLQELVDNEPGERLSLAQVVQASEDGAFGIIIMLLAIPSALPLPAAGLSTPFGVGIFLVAAQMIYGRKTLWLPRGVLKLSFSKDSAQRFISSLSWLLKKFEVFIRPRLAWMTGRIGQIWMGGLIAGLAIVMQMPIPLTNTAPAGVIFLLAMALTEDDGLAGIVFSTLALIVIATYIAGFIAIIFFGFQGLEQAFDYFKALFAN